MVQGIIAGGDKALRFAIEGAEDSVECAKNDFEKANITENDTIVAISASGNANYVIEILKLAKEKNCKTISLTCNKEAKMSEFADVVIAIETGAEAITGSTRMKAGTAQKMVLNMLTTGSMVKIGKTYQNLMIDVKPTNIKLKDRAVRIVSKIEIGSLSPLNPTFIVLVPLSITSACGLSSPIKSIFLFSFCFLFSLFLSFI